MKKVLILIFVLLCIASFSHAERVKLECSGIVYTERTAALDAAFSMLEKDNPFLAYYNKTTKANVEGGQKYDSDKFALISPPKFTKDNASIIQIMDGMRDGDYLINRDTGEVMICIGAIIVSGFDKESAPSLKSHEYYPVVLHKGQEGVRVSVVGLPGIVFDGYEVMDLQMEKWTAFTWFRI